MLKRGKIVGIGTISGSTGANTNSVAPSSSEGFGGTKQNRPFVKIAALPQLRRIFLGLSLMQRQQLRVIVKRQSHPLNTTVTAELITLGLVRLDGDAPTATEDGRYVASLY